MVKASSSRLILGHSEVTDIELQYLAVNYEVLLLLPRGNDLNSYAITDTMCVTSGTR